MPLDALIASIPSPSFNQLGPFRLYGLCIALGVVAAVVISSKRWEARGGDPDDIGTIAIWAVPAGVIGARIYHVATDWKTYQDDWIDALKITQGGLGIPGGIFFGVLAGVVVVRVKRLPTLPLLDVVAPALPVAQAIGRLGNYFNQEVYGRPTTLPWGLEIDPNVSPDAAAYAPGTLFHPTFLYEGLWNLGLALLLVWIDRKKVLRPGELFALYVLGYGIGRLWVEALRLDQASLVLGVRINIWMSLVLIVGSLLSIAWLRRRPMPAEVAAAGPSGTVAGTTAPGGSAEATGTADAPEGDEPDADASGDGGADAQGPGDGGSGDGGGDGGSGDGGGGGGD